MKFSAREDISGPIEQVFDALCDFEAFERLAMRRGAELQRVDSIAQPGVGMQWRVKYRMRGRKREFDLALIEFDRPNQMVFDAKSSGIEAKFSVDLLALSRSRTRMAVALDMTPLNLSARLLIQSLKLAKSNLSKRFKDRVADYCKGLGERLQRTA
ncbi:SRPBCC family protein [uncultured Tateyamaria sp.]|uniref:SRPBCC family protein n=1 Tax=uncultured Tateyamaria sp. TaxID=455651 RepID=UPI002625C53B|nr:SRPBCC family protein [uncultured Tateyamaria sp.]